jgi:hypothetical protein
VVYLLKLMPTRNPFTTPTAITLRLSDRPYRYPEPPATNGATMTPPAEQWLPLVQSWGGLEDAIDPPTGTIAVAGFDITVDNTTSIAGVARFSDLMRAGRNDAGYDFPFSPAELYQVFEGVADTSRHRLFRLVVEELTSITDQTAILKLSGIELVMEDLNVLPVIDTFTFPAAAPDAVNQKIPWLAGQVRRIPLLFAKAGLVDKLSRKVTSAYPATGGRLQLSDPDLVARFPDAGIVQFKVTTDTGTSAGGGSTSGGGTLWSTPSLPSLQQGGVAECVSYAAKDVANAALLQIVRGVRDTIPGAAEAGTDVYQVLDEYVGIAGVNLGPSAAAALTAVYCDDMVKADTTLPRHTIEMENTTFWPPYSLTLVRFTPGVTVPASFGLAAEVREVAYHFRDNDCYPANTVSDDTGNWMINGVGCMRVGLGCPCSAPTEFFAVQMRFPIADLPLDPGAPVILRFWRGVFPSPTGDNVGGQPPGWGLGPVALTYVTDWDGVIGPFGTYLPWEPVGHYGNVTGTADYAIVVTPDTFHNQFVYADVSYAYHVQRTYGLKNLILTLNVPLITQSALTASPIPPLSDWAVVREGPPAWQGTWPPFTSNWYAVGARPAAYAPQLFLAGTADSGASGALLTRPSGGSSRSAAEASLGVVTVDITGPDIPDPVLNLDGTALDWRNGFEEGSIVLHNTDSLSSVWTTITGTGVSIVPGIHHASQHAIRFESRGTASGVYGGNCQKAFSVNYGAGNFYGKAMVMGVVVPHGGTNYFEILRIGDAGHGYKGQVFWLSTGKYRLVHNSAGTSADSATVLGAGVLHRLEWRLTFGAAGAVELRIFAGDSLTPLETLVLPGDPGGILGSVAWMGAGGVDVAATIDMDDVGVSNQSWMGPGTNIIAVPTANVSVQWTPSAGTNYQCIDDHPGPLDDSTYISAATPGLADQYAWTIPAAALVPTTARFYRATVYLRARTPGTARTLLPIIWDEHGHLVNGRSCPIGSPGMTNPGADQYTVYAVGGRTLAAMLGWKLGVQAVSAPLDVSVLYALLEYR